MSNTLCPICHGTGWSDPWAGEPCERCGGSGVVRRDDDED